MTARKIRALYKEAGIAVYTLPSGQVDGAMYYVDTKPSFARFPPLRSQWTRLVAMHELSHALLDHGKLEADVRASRRCWSLNGDHTVVEAEYDTWKHCVMAMEENLAPATVAQVLDRLMSYVRAAR